MAEPTAEAQDDEDAAPKKRSRLPLILGMVLALAGGGGGFYAAWSGLLLGADPKAASAKAGEEMGKDGGKDSGGMGAPILGDAAYVEIDPLVISLPATTTARHLRFRANLEVPMGAEAEVKKVIPRVIDVLNSYLRAVDPSDLEDPTSLARLRAQMLRRVQVVTGLEKVNDLLIMEFVLT